MPVRLNNNRVFRPAEIQHEEPACAPAAHRCSPSKSCAGVHGGDMTLPYAIDGAERCFRQRGRQRSHLLYMPPTTHLACSSTSSTSPCLRRSMGRRISRFRLRE